MWAFLVLLKYPALPLRDLLGEQKERKFLILIDVCLLGRTGRQKPANREANFNLTGIIFD
jgi:hypothetical protein